MHICLVIDLLTAIFLINGIRAPSSKFHRLLSLAALIFLAFISLHTYISLARYFGFFERHPSLTTYGLDALLRFFGGFWMLFGVMVLAKAVSWIALAFAIYAVLRWYNTSRKSIPDITVLRLRSPQPPD